MRIKNKALLLLMMILLNPVMLLAQDFGAGEPCGNANPDDTTPCPLDTWVFILALIAMAFTVYHLQRNKKVLTAA